MADEIDEIRQRADIVELVGQRVSLKKAGRDWKGLCPFHDDKNPSFTVSPEYGRYRCWSCGATGDVFNWVMETMKVDFAEALEILAKETGVELKRGGGPRKEPGERERQESAMDFAQRFFRAELEKSPVAREYTERRGLPKEILDRWEIGYAPSVGEALALQLAKEKFSLVECKGLFLVDQDASGGFYDRFRGRLMFPIRDERGRLVAFGGRIVGDGQPKYINSSDTPLYKKSRVLYGMHLAKEPIAASRRAVLCEGYMDVIACHRAGVTQAVASLGTALADDHVKLLKRWCDEVVILYDADAAGLKAADRACELLEEGGLRVRIASVGDGKDPDDLLESGGPEAVQRIVDEAVSPLEFRLRLLRARSGPEDEGYWREVVQILAACPNPMEVQKYLLPVAKEYPGSRDPVAARRALEGMVEEARREAAGGKKRSGPEFERAGTLTKAMPKLAGPEIAVFRALVVPGLREEAWRVCSDPDLFMTTVGEKIAGFLTESFDSVPVESPVLWIGKLKSEGAKRALSDLLMDEFHPVTDGVLREAVQTLETKREERRARQDYGASKGNEGLRELHERLKRLKNAENP